MDAGSLAQMSSSTFNGPNGLAMSNAGGLASRRGGQTIKPLSFEALKPVSDKDTGVTTPRTSRSHLLAGLRTAPKSATAATFPASPNPAAANNQRFARNGAPSGLYGGHDGINGPKTSLPRYNQTQTYNNNTGNTYGQQYTTEQILAPPEIQLDDQDASSLGAEYAELMATNMYLAEQKQRLQQQLMSVQAAQQQFQSMSIGSGPQGFQQANNYQQLLYQQQQQQQQQMLAANNMYAVVDPMTGHQTFYVGQGGAQLNNHFVDQYNTNLQQLQQLQLIQHQLQQQQNLQKMQQRQSSPAAAPRVHISPPSSDHYGNMRNPSPPRHLASTPEQHAPLPPPSANAFRRGHKKALSLVGSNLSSINTAGLALGHEPPKSAGPKTTSFPPICQPTGTYGPGQGRAGEHPTRQPRGPPSFDELARKPTAKDEGSKNFAARTRRSAVHNLMRAGLTRRQVTGSGSSGSISPISETAEELPAAMTDDESVSGRSGSGSLNGDDVECSLPSSRTSTGSWGAIGSERPGSREKARADSPHSPSESSANGSFASVFKSAAPSAETDIQRKPSMLVLSNTEKRRCAAA